VKQRLTPSRVYLFEMAGEFKQISKSVTIFASTKSAAREWSSLPSVKARAFPRRLWFFSIFSIALITHGAWG